MIAPVTLIQLNACGGALDMAPEKFGFLRDSSEAAVDVVELGHCYMAWPENGAQLLTRT
jgi:hypothetical protein